MSPLTLRGNHAVVIGGSIAGLVSARVLSNYFARVTVIERDHLPANSGPSDFKAIVMAEAPPFGRRGGALMAIEDERWICTLFGYSGDHPPLDEATFNEFARSLPAPEVYNTIQKATPIVEEPWALASGADLDYAHIEGKRSLAVKLIKDEPLYLTEIFLRVKIRAVRSSNGA